VFNVRKLLWWIYGLQAFFIFLMFLGGIARHEIPFWPSWNSAVDVYVHLIFYSVFLVLPYVLLSAAYREDTAGMEGHFFIISVWLLATICLFHEPIFGFVGAFFGGLFDSAVPAWYQWLHILWLALTVVMIILWRAVSAAKMKRRVQKWD
jgi:hypothetical protein